MNFKTLIEDKFKKYRRNKLLTGMITLIVGAGVSRLVTLLSIPILTRIYSPEKYGVLAVYTSIVFIIAPLVTLRYVVAVTLPRRDVLAFNLLALSFILTLTVAMLFGSVFALYGESILSSLSISPIIEHWWLIILGVTGTVVYEILSAWALRKKEYRALANTQIRQSLFGEITKIVLGLFPFLSNGLIVGQIVSQSSGGGFLLKKFSTEFHVLIKKVKLKYIYFLLLHYWKFPLLRLPSQLLLVGSSQAPILFAAFLYDVKQVGYLSLALTILALPVNLVGQSIGKAYYAEISALGKRKTSEIYKVTLALQKSLFKISIPICAVIFLFVSDIFEFVFGEAWAQSGDYAKILSPFVLLQLTSAPLMQVLNVVGKQEMFLFFNVVRGALLILLCWTVSTLMLSIETFVIAYSVIMVLVYLLLTLYIMWYLRRISGAERAR